MDTAADVVAQLKEQGHTVATAESLTGGMLAAAFTSVPGASACFVGSVVSYATRVKESVLGVPHEVVETHGVVSRACAEAMAAGVRTLLDTTHAIATTGVAGPDLQEGKPVGTVWVAVAAPDGVRSALLSLEGGRNEIREATCREAISLLGGILRREQGALG